MHSLKELIEWKMSADYQMQNITDLVDEMETNAKKVGSNQFLSICADIRKRLK